MKRRTMDRKIEVLSTVRVKKTDDLYKIVDALNRTLHMKGTKPDVWPCA
jgi:hypothetical protein